MGTRTLVLALYAEGPTDNHFLPSIIQRTAERIINYYGRDIVDVLEPIIVPKQTGKNHAVCILSAARYAHGYDALIVHADADDRSSDAAKLHRIEPGFNLVFKTNADVCKNLLPLIPVQMIESWMLADHTALREVIGTDLSPENLGLPSRPALVEFDANPKQTLNDVIQKALSNRPQRRRQIDFNTRQETLARKIDPNVLHSVPSYKEFSDNFKNTLEKLHFIPISTSKDAHD